MSQEQEQPMREQDLQEDSGAQAQAQGIRYGDVFNVTGDLAGQPIAPQDAATMQKAEYVVLGAPQPGGAADIMTSAATLNQYTGVVGANQAGAAAAAQERDVTVTETPIPGGKIVTEFVAGQAVGQYAVPFVQTGAQESGSRQGTYYDVQGSRDMQRGDGGGENQGSDQGNVDNSRLTIGEALEATGRAIGNKPVQSSDAEAIMAAESTACGADVPVPGGIGDAAIAAARANVSTTHDEEKIKLSDILSNATAKLPADKPAEQEDAARVVNAEVGSNQSGEVRPGGVAVAVATAAKINQDDTSLD